MRTVNAAIAGTLLLLAACNQQPATVESTIPKYYWGRYTGAQSGYEMRDSEGKIVKVNGKGITVPAIKNTVDIDGSGIAWQQDGPESDARRTVDYDRVVPATIESTKDWLVVECTFTANEGRSNPKRIFRFDLTNRTITMLGDRGSADCPLSRQ